MSEAAEYLEEVLDHLMAAVITMTPEFKVIWCNEPARTLAPMAVPGANLMEVLLPATNPEKIDRLLLRGEKVMFSAGPDIPLLEWLVTQHVLPGGDLILMAWDPNIADEMVQRRATFAMAAAHELRSPLTALIGFAEIFEMENENLSPVQLEAASIIRQNALYLESLVNDILDLSSNSFGELTLDLEQLDVGESISEVVASLAGRFSERDQNIEVNLEPGLPEIEADRRRLRQVLETLIHNASIHCPDGTRVEVRAEVRDRGIVVEVIDDGPGLPFDRPETAFSMFEHAGTVDFGEMTGSGIGLPLAKRLTELHRGRIAVESSDSGCKFEVWLPLDRARALTRTPPGAA